MDYILLHIIPEYLDDRSKIRLLSTCKAYIAMRERVRYKNFYRYHSIKHLSFIGNFDGVSISTDKELDEHMLQYVTHLYYSGPTIIRMPRKLDYLHIEGYNGPISGWLPNILRVLTLEGNFNYPLKPGDIPHGVEHVILGGDFNQLLSGCIPKTTKYLQIDGRFEQPIYPGDLPEGLEYLEITSDFTHSLSGCLPSTLKNLSMSIYIHQLTLHEGLKYLTIGYSIYPIAVPKSLKALYVDSKCYRGNELERFKKN